MAKRVGYHWHLRRLMAERGMFATTWTARQPSSSSPTSTRPRAHKADRRARRRRLGHGEHGSRRYCDSESSVSGEQRHRQVVAAALATDPTLSAAQVQAAIAAVAGHPAALRSLAAALTAGCYTAALRHRGTWGSCLAQRRLVSPPGPDATTCAGLPASHVCTDCGLEDKLYERGRCERCALVRRTGELLHADNEQIPPALIPIHDAITATPTPRTALNWLRNGAGAAVLADLAAGTTPSSHPALDAVVLCMDEKSQIQIQALDRRIQPSLPMTKGRAGTTTHDYKRHGTTLFAALNVTSPLHDH